MNTSRASSSPTEQVVAHLLSCIYISYPATAVVAITITKVARVDRIGGSRWRRKPVLSNEIRELRQWRIRLGADWDSGRVVSVGLGSPTSTSAHWLV